MVDSDDLNQRIVSQIVDNLESNNQIMQTLVNSHQENTKLLTTMEVKMENFTKELDFLSVLVRGHNGSDSVTSRLNLVEHRIKQLEGIEGIYKEERIEELRQEKQFTKKTLWNFVQLFVSALLGSVCTLFVSYFLKTVGN